MKEQEFIEKYRPMLAVMGKPFNDPNYIYEIKWDGIRCILVLLPEITLLISRNGNIMNNRYPELTSPIKSSLYPLVLDGEIVYFEGGKPNFQKLLARDRLKNPGLIDKQVALTPVEFMAFDILRYGEEELINLDLKRRKEYLKICLDNLNSKIIKISEYIKGQGLEFFQAAKDMGLEGVMAKDINSKYNPGKRSQQWIKFKAIITENFMVCGYLPGLRAGLGSLILGQSRPDGKIYYQGQVGTGFSEEEARVFKEYLDQNKIPKPGVHNASGLKNPQWVSPIIKVQVEYLERTKDGLLRHPSYKGVVKNEKQ
jgi:DNA ligase D-like protein (predicted ligase)